MPGFVREHLRPLMGSAGLHLLLLVLVAGAALRWTSTQPPVQLAIEGVVVDAKDLPKSARAGKPVPPPKVTPPPEIPKPQPEPKPQSEPVPPQPDVKAEEAQARERAAEARAAREKAAAEEERGG
jgi:outer membrane biosynthesis protein TonB